MGHRRHSRLGGGATDVAAGRPSRSTPVRPGRRPKLRPLEPSLLVRLRLYRRTCSDPALSIATLWLGRRRHRVRDGTDHGYSRRSHGLVVMGVKDCTRNDHEGTDSACRCHPGGSPRHDPSCGGRQLEATTSARRSGLRYPWIPDVADPGCSHQRKGASLGAPVAIHGSLGVANIPTSFDAGHVHRAMLGPDGADRRTSLVVVSSAATAGISAGVGSAAVRVDCWGREPPDYRESGSSGASGPLGGAIAAEQGDEAWSTSELRRLSPGCSADYP